MADRQTGRVRVRVPATTTNLGPGFDCIGMALALYNEVALEAEAEAFRIEIEGEGRGQLPEDASNLVYRAAAWVYEAAGRALPPLRVALVNRVPVGRGLGSSAAALVGGLVGANALLGNPFSLEALLARAVEWEGHPDNVIPALVGGWTVACMEGGLPRYLRLEMPEGWRVVAAVPLEETSTRAARRALPASVPFEDAAFNVGRTALLVASLLTGRYEYLPVATQDRLHQPYRQALNPAMEPAIRAAREAGAPGACLSGSGSTVIALARERPEAIASAMACALAEKGFWCRTWVLEPAREGASVREGG